MSARKPSLSGSGTKKYGGEVISKAARKRWNLAKRVLNPEVRRALLDGKKIDKWVPNDESKNCMMCDVSFGLLVRKHHCRRCGMLVCQNCSTRKVKFSNTSSLERICDECFDVFFDKSSSTSNPHPLERRPTARALGPEEGSFEGIPFWMFFFKPLGNLGKTMPIGDLYVRVIEAKNLPKMDFIGTADPYVVLNLGDVTAKTASITNTLNPIWKSAAYRLEVYNCFDVLKLSVFDHDLNSKDDLIGIVEIPVADLSHEVRFERWYDLKLSADVIKEARSGGKEPPRSEIRLELHYSFNKVGEFFSHFTSPPADPKPEPEFELMRTVNVVFRLLDLLQPVFGFFGLVGQIISWSDTFTSSICLVLFILFCLYPWTLALYLQGFLLFHMIRCKVEKKITERPSHQHLSLKERDESMKKKFVEELDEKRMIVEKSGEEKFDSLLTGLASKSISATGLKETMKWLQNLLAFICDIIELVYNLFNWSNPIVTQSIFIIVCLTFTYTLFFDFRWIVLLSGFYVLTMNTIPGITFMWLLMGTIRYMTRPKPRSESIVRWNKAIISAKASNRLEKSGIKSSK